MITYGKEELQEILISKLQEQFIQDGIENLNVINKIVNFYDKNSSIEVEMTYEVEENIGIESEIEVN